MTARTLPGSSTVLWKFKQLGRDNPDAAGVEIRLLVAMTLDISEEEVIETLGPQLYILMREQQDREVQWRRKTNRVGYPPT